MGVVRNQGISNTVLVYLGTAIGFLSLVFIQPHYLTQEELGLTRLILSFASVLSIFFSLGISAVTVRYLPRTLDTASRHRGFFGFLLLYTGLSVLAGTLLLYAARGPLLRFYGSPEIGEQFDYVLLLTVILSFVLGFNAYCIALMRTTVTTLLNDIVVRVLFIAVIFIHFHGWTDLQGFLLAFCLVYGVQAMALLISIFWTERPGLVPDMRYIRDTIGLRPILRFGVVITLTAMNSVTLKYVDTMFVGTISVELVAVYSVAAFLGLAVEIPLNALERVANPGIAHALARDDKDALRVVYHDSARALLLVGGWLFLTIALNAHDIFQLLPPEYAAGAVITQVIAFGALINMGTGVNYPILVNSHRYIWGPVFLVVLLALTIIGNLLLIPRIGLLGPAVAGCAASIVYNVLKYEFIRRNFHLQPFDGATLKQALLIGAVFALGCIVPVPLPPIPAILVRTAIVTALYITITVLWRTSADLYRYIPPRLSKRFAFLR